MPNFTKKNILSISLLAFGLVGIVTFTREYQSIKISKIGAALQDTSVDNLSFTNLRPCTFKTKWGTTGSSAGQFDKPVSVAVLPFDHNNIPGIIFVADTGNHRIQQFDSNGNFIRQIGSQGKGNDQFDSPEDISFDDSQILYVADTGNHRIKVYWGTSPDKTLELRAVFGSYGKETGQLDTPVSVEGAKNEDELSATFLVADTNNHRVQKVFCDLFSGICRVLSIWGNRGTENGQFIFPESIASDYSNGDIYVADASLRIQKFTKEGKFITKWGTQGVGDSQFTGPISISVDGSRNVVVMDSGAHIIKRFSPDGIFINKWSALGKENSFNNPRGIDADWGIYSRGDLYVADTGNNQIQKFNCDLSLCKSSKIWGGQGKTNGKFEFLSGITVDKNGYVFVSDNTNQFSRIQKFDANGVFIKKWGSWGNEQGNFKFVTDLSVDSSGNIYVVDSGNSRIQKFNNNGTFIKMWGKRGSGNGEFYDPYAGGVDSSNNLYITESASNQRVQKFTANGVFLTKWGSPGSGNGQFDHPTGISIAQNSKVYVADESNNRIQKFSTDGNFVLSFGNYGYPGTSEKGPANGFFHYPTGVAMSKEGNIFVTDKANNRIQEFTPEGFFLSRMGNQFGTSGNGSDEFFAPEGLAFKPGTNTLYIADSANYRVKKYNCNYTPSTFPP